MISKQSSLSLRPAAAALALIALGLLPCCSSTSSSYNRRGDSLPGGSSTVTNEAAVYGKVRNARIVLKQAKNDTYFIMANMDHESRQTPQGRLALALGNPNLGYRVKTDKSIDALLRSFETYNHRLIIEPWQESDTRYLRAKDGSIPGFRGIIVVENDGQRYKMMGRRPNGLNDVLGQQKYATFSELKQLILGWYTSEGAIEQPNSALQPGSASEIRLN